MPVAYAFSDTLKTFIKRHFFTPILIVWLTLLSTHSTADQFSLEKPMLNAIEIVNAAKIVIFSEQRIINSPNPEGKEILFGEAFITQVEKRYREIYGRDIPYRSHPLTQELLFYLPFVNELNRTLIYDSSVKFKGIIAATYTSQLSHLLTLKQNAMHLKFTAPKQLLRNKLNTPDGWEQATLARFQSSKWPQGKAYFESNVAINERFASRIMLPLYFTPTCLSCHGQPINNPANNGKKQAQWTNIDVSGFTMENMRNGDFAGAISFIIFNDSFINCKTSKSLTDLNCKH